MAMDLIDTGDLWKYKFRALQLRLRDRLRVAVDKHWHRNRLGIISEGYFSSTIQRLALRVRNLREESLPAASKFYRKRVNKDALEDSALVRMVQAVAVPVLGNVCHVFMNGLNHIQVYGVEKLHEALLRRPEGKPLITVSNHVASVDDPFVIASLVPPNVMLDARNLRWTLCATDRCFKNPVTSAFFRSVKVLPVSRGDGIYQNGMDMALSKLNNGGWVHIFPEGSRSRDGGRTMGSTKRGVGRLVMDADKIPIVLPFVHTGMQDIMPIGANFPRIGQMYQDGTTDITRTVHFGKPSAHEKACYTAVLKGHIALDTARFPNGTNGHALDILARVPLWKDGLDYRHGTGHGIGSFLNVHEGPHLISFRPQARNVPIQASMTVTDEPGYYEDGNFGIRLENVLIVNEAKTKFNFGDKGYLSFEHITWTPYQTKLMNLSLLSPEEIQWVNEYHSKCREVLGQYLDESEMAWLKKATEPISIA